jgi:hypothetical protein
MCAKVLMSIKVANVVIVTHAATERERNFVQEAGRFARRVGPGSVVSRFNCFSVIFCDYTGQVSSDNWQFGGTFGIRLRRGRFQTFPIVTLAKVLF